MLVKLFRMLKKRLDKMDTYLEELSNEVKNSSKRLNLLQHQIQQPRLAMEADVK